MGNFHGNDLDEDDDVMIAILLAQDGIVLHQLLEEAVGGNANRSGRKRYRRVFQRPNYSESVWWRMLEKGECKIPGTREYKLFRRRFGVGFERYKTFCEAARTWNGIAKGNDAIGRSPVPLELKVLGALRMVCKGCAFDAIAELSGMSVGANHASFFPFLLGAVRGSF